MNNLIHGLLFSATKCNKNKKKSKNTHNFAVKKTNNFTNSAQ